MGEHIATEFDVEVIILVCYNVCVNSYVPVYKVRVSCYEKDTDDPIGDRTLYIGDIHVLFGKLQHKYQGSAYRVYSNPVA